MTQYTLPLLFLNLGGEMLYVLDQRLRAQKVPSDKARKVMDEIAGIMFNEKFLDELFKPRELYDRASLRNVFHDIAHSSLMRLNNGSMNKLYDLMTMVFKQQVFSAREPKDLILITLNHIDSIRYLVSVPAIYKQLDATYFLIMKTYGQMSSGELQRIRFHLLNFFQDARVRVCIFLRQQLQNSDGSFVVPTANCMIAHGNEIPGSIRIYGKDGCISDLQCFPTGGQYSVAAEAGSLELRGTRHTLLGTNIYTTKMEDTHGTWEQAVLDSFSDQMDSSIPSTSYRDELNLLLVQLQGSEGPPPDSQEIVYLNIFDVSEEENKGILTSTNVKVTSQIDGQHNVMLQKVLNEMTLQEPGESTTEVNILQLMDESGYPKFCTPVNVECTRDFRRWLISVKGYPRRAHLFLCIMSSETGGRFIKKLLKKFKETMAVNVLKNSLKQLLEFNYFYRVEEFLDVTL